MDKFNKNSKGKKDSNSKSAQPSDNIRAEDTNKKGNGQGNNMQAKNCK